MSRAIYLLISILNLCFTQCKIEISGSLKPVSLSVENQQQPLGIDILNPRFSWKYFSEEQNKYQSAYRILVSASRDLLKDNKADMWDSGIKNEMKSINIDYGGVPLASFTPYYWKVMAWDESGNPTSWSEINEFETSMINEVDWSARWIGEDRPVPANDADFYKIIPAPIFRKSFELDGAVKNARLYISGLGYYEAFLNGQKVGDNVLDPGWTNYGKEVLYSTYDVTSQVSNGENALGVLLGNGWYNPLPLGLFRKFNLRKYLTIGKPKLLSLLRIELTDGTVLSIGSDETWKSSESYILKNNVYLGEVQDGKLKSEEWKKPGYDDSSWDHVMLESAPGGKLKSQMVPPIKITASLNPVKLSEPSPGVYVYDLGQNFAGWIHFKVNEPENVRINFLYGEMLNDDGTVNGMTTVAGHIKEIWNLSGGSGSPKTAFQKDQYIANGKDNDEFQQHFTFHGFRYVQISGLSKSPELMDLRGLRLSASFNDGGDFKCSSALFNKIQEMVEWTFLSNVFSVQSDCPGREKFGYGADMVTSAEAFIYNYDMANFYRKTVSDFANDVRSNGGMPECAPYNGIDTEGFGEGTGPIGWQLAFPFIQKQLYSFYGDKRVIKENYDLTKGMVEFLRSQAENNLIYHGISDHVSVDPKPEALTSGAFYYHHVKLLAEFAEILGKSEDMANYNDLASTIRKAFIQEYLIPGTGRFDTLTTEITQVFALWYDLVPDTEKGKAFDVLIEKILQKHHGHLSTGIFGTKMLFDVLRDYNRNDVAFMIINQRDYPGYGYMIENGATTLWENWELPEQNSLNHPMFGSVSEWFYRSVLGINPRNGAFGFDKIYIKPFIAGDLLSADGIYRSVRGDVKCTWNIENGTLSLNISIPANIDANLHIPTSEVGAITIDGIPISKVREMEFIEYSNGYAVYHAGNGRFNIQSKL